MQNQSLHNPFDTATKHLLEADPLAWLRFLGLPGSKAHLENTNLTTLTADADRILWVGEEHKDDSYLADIEFQASGEEEGDERVFLYAALTFRKYRKPVESVVILLRPEAEAGFTGRTGFTAPGSSSLAFTYQIVKVWETPVENLLSGSLASCLWLPLQISKRRICRKLFNGWSIALIEKPNQGSKVPCGRQRICSWDCAMSVA